MSRRAARAKLCPTPSKQRHLSADDAVHAGATHAAHLRLAHIEPETLYVYQCPCLWWHLTHHQYGHGGVRHRPVTA